MTNKMNKLQKFSDIHSFINYIVKHSQELYWLLQPSMKFQKSILQKHYKVAYWRKHDAIIHFEF